MIRFSNLKHDATTYADAVSHEIIARRRTKFKIQPQSPAEVFIPPPPPEVAKQVEENKGTVESIEVCEGCLFSG